MKIRKTIDDSYELQRDFKSGDYVTIKGASSMIFRAYYYDVYGEHQGWQLSTLVNQEEYQERWGRIKNFLKKKGDTTLSECSPYIQHRYNEFSDEDKRLIDLIVPVRSMLNEDRYRYFIDPSNFQYMTSEKECVKVLELLKIDSMEEFNKLKHHQPNWIWRFGYKLCPIFLVTMFITLIGCGWSCLCDGSPESTWSPLLAVILLLVMLLTGWSIIPLLKALAKRNELASWNSPANDTPTNILWNNMGSYISGFIVATLCVYLPNFYDWLVQYQYTNNETGIWYMILPVLGIIVYPYGLVQQGRLLYNWTNGPEFYYTGISKSEYKIADKKAYLEFYGLYDKGDGELREIFKHLEEKKEDDKIWSQRERHAGCCNWSCPFADREAIKHGVDRHKEGIRCPDFLRCEEVKKAWVIQSAAD